MLLSFLRWVKGSVAFRVSGDFPERFMNIAAARGVNLWNTRPVKGGLESVMSARDYRKILPLARRARVKSKILKKSGLPFIVKKYTPRAGILIGAALGAVLLLVLSNFIWTVSISGLETVSESKINRVLEDNGVKSGVWRTSVDTSKVKRELLLKIDELRWATVNIFGCNAGVEVREKAEKPKDGEKETPSNIKAKEDGVITKIIAKNGIAEIKKGSGAAKGDLLVSGVELLADNSVSYVRAEAEVYADVRAKQSFTIPKSSNYFSLSENKTDRRRLSFLNFELPVSIAFQSYDNTAYTCERDNLALNGVTLPLGFVTETAHCLNKNKNTCDRQKAEKIFNASMLLYELFEQGDGVPVSKKIKVTEDDNSYFFDAEYIFNKNIAENVDFSVTEE